MCIAILTLKGKMLDRETFDRCWQRNDDGAGLAYSNGKEMVLVKELKNRDRFWRLYEKHRLANLDIPMLVHFRIKTHGAVNLESTQPIQINKGLAYIHNGVIHDVKTDKILSDTVMFKRQILAHLPNGFHLNSAHRDLIAKYIGVGSKLVFLDLKHRWAIINEKAGVWEDQIWYSHSGFRGWETAKNVFNQGEVKTAYQRGSCGTHVGAFPVNRSGNLNPPLPTDGSWVYQLGFWRRWHNGKEEISSTLPQHAKLSMQQTIGFNPPKEESRTDKMLERATQNVLGVKQTAPLRMTLTKTESRYFCHLCSRRWVTGEDVFHPENGGNLCSDCAEISANAGYRIVSKSKVTQDPK